MDRYNQKWVRVIFRTDPWAITIGQTTYYSCPKWYVDKRPRWRSHEERHKQQWRREGAACFLTKYIYYHIRYGYEKNPYEIEARRGNQ